MRQVPNYLIIGNGRLSQHFQYYFNQLGLNCRVWSREMSYERLSEQSAEASHILLLITDSAIESFIQRYLTSSKAVLVHCSGSLATNQAYGAHPLMTFANDLYEEALYSSIPFVLDEDAPAMEALLPGLPNASFRLPKKEKAKYHALCVMAGNFSCLLWQKLMNTFQKEFKLPGEIAHPYLQQQMINLMQQPENALTGPLARNDKNTIEKNLLSLKDDPFRQVYESFINCYQQLNEQI